MAKILVVDDEASIVTMLAYNLKKEGYDVVTAEDGEVALEKFESEKPDLLLLDIMMPKMDGYEVCRKIREKVMCLLLCLQQELMKWIKL